MHSKYWLDKWNTGETHFHQSEFEPLLLKYFPKLEPTKVWVPLCGKSRDMVWLANQGHEVIGTELSPIACHEFFMENYQGNYQKESKGTFTVFRGLHTTLYCGDFFQMDSTLLLGVKAVYDRAALIALPSEMRKKYVSHLTQLLLSLSTPLQILLLTLEYTQDKAQGPPFSVDDKEVRALYPAYFHIQHLLREEDLELPLQNKKFHGTRVFENVHLISH